MRKTRAVFEVSIDLDPIDSSEDCKRQLQHILDHAIKHYNPLVRFITELDYNDVILNTIEWEGES